MTDETFLIIENHYLGSTLKKNNLILFIVSIQELIVYNHFLEFLIY